MGTGWSVVSVMAMFQQQPCLPHFMALPCAALGGARQAFSIQISICRDGTCSDRTGPPGQLHELLLAASLAAY